MAPLLFAGFFSILMAVAAGDAAPASDLANPAEAFDKNFQIMFARDHVKTSEDGQVWHLLLDRKSGSGFQSKNRYRFGWFSMKLKLVPGDSAGVVTAYYMSSNNDDKTDKPNFDRRDELDFEFLGNRSGQPYALQTNVYVNGTGGREQRHTLWFDPTEEFHTYSVLWNNHQIVFFADLVPLRVLRHTEATEGVFPKDQPMYMFSSIWNADDWATRGGLDKTNWTAGPFVSSYKKFRAMGCVWEDPYPPCVSTTSENWWDQPDSWTLSDAQRKDYAWSRRNFLLYDYCNDTKRYTELPLECSVDPW